MAEDVSEGDAGAKFTLSGVGCHDAEWKGWGWGSSRRDFHLGLYHDE